MYIFYEDPGHGWLRVPKTEISPEIKNKISQFSYMNGNYAYLEEDCDAGLFMLEKWGSYEEAHKHIRNKHTDNSSRIRGYEPYNPNELSNYLSK